MNLMNRLETIRTAALAAQRRRQQLIWQEQFNRLAQTPARTPEERLAKFQALSLMEQARIES